MQTLEVISVNLWQILLSLANLVILFFILKKFLYKPVKKVLAERQAEIDSGYAAAAEAERSATADRDAWREKIKTAEAEAQSIIKTANDKANENSDRIIGDAKDKARDIIRRAEAEADLEYKKAQDDIKQEIVVVSTVLTEKMLEREIDEKDHRELIEAFISNMGDSND
ncbi:MAG: F0F1 ATP synthase subunit B [Clostridia bacterium]|nr:F0F1 ATP synthase subunit B [Clostridia bacterium]